MGNNILPNTEVEGFNFEEMAGMNLDSVSMEYGCWHHFFQFSDLERVSMSFMRLQTPHEDKINHDLTDYINIAQGVEKMLINADSMSRNEQKLLLIFCIKWLVTFEVSLSRFKIQQLVSDLGGQKFEKYSQPTWNEFSDCLEPLIMAMRGFLKTKKIQLLPQQGRDFQGHMSDLASIQKKIQKTLSKD